MHRSSLFLCSAEAENFQMEIGELHKRIDKTFIQLFSDSGHNYAEAKLSNNS